MRRSMCKGKEFCRLFVIALCLSAGPSALGVNPLGFPSYEQIVSVTYATGEEAEDAALSVTPIPGGRTASFGTRWDDSSFGHQLKCEMLCRAGVSGTFFLNESESFLKEVAPRLLVLGHSVGNHTLHHPFMMEPSADRLFIEILGQRIRAESALDTTVVSYVSPFGWGGSLDSERLPLVRKIVFETGHFMTSDNPPESVGFDPRTWFTTRVFSANDRMPDDILFASNLAVNAQCVLSDSSVPRLSFGIHSWCKSEGNDIQERWLKVVKASHPDWWFANDNEYAAYRYEFLNGRIAKIRREGCTAVFRVTRFAPAQLGAVVPLSLRPSGDPVSVAAEGTALSRGRNGTWMLPHADGKGMPKKVDCASANGRLGKFPGLELSLTIEGRSLVAAFSNKSPSNIVDLYAVAYLPPRWKKGRDVLQADVVKSGETRMFRVWMGDLCERMDYRLGNAFYAVSVDFLSEGDAGRIWATRESCFVSRDDKSINPNGAAVVLGPIATSKVNDEILISFSRPGSELRDLGSGVTEKWRRGGDPDRVPSVVYVDVPYEHRDDNLSRAIKSAKMNPEVATLAAFDFETTSGCARVFFNGWSRPRSPWTALCVDGRKIPCSGKGRAIIPVSKKGGVHRLVVCWGRPVELRHEQTVMVGLSDRKDAFNEILPCRPIPLVTQPTELPFPMSACEKQR